MIRVFRWILVIPAAVLGYMASMFIGMSTLFAFEKFCPPDLVISEMCTAGYMHYVEAICLLLFSSLAAVLVVLLPSLIAPANKQMVAGAAYIVGAVTALYIGLELGAYLVLLSVLASGALTLYLVHRTLTKHALTCD
ncbi:hypothetical protein EZV61_13725 [Corallincola luteus]|uniref:Uncharacterized protein n=1 Tax=Corallincola luteus TaxID=1775177 RepID=A0ABY2AK54_9GAMM|nr:hypothetical protein [Corallincola luteus]TCI02412.1 hypothetical protein EZV61_13725 [Corallincola luteus]